MAILEENDILFAHKALNIMSGLTEATRRVAGAIIDHFNKKTGQCDPSIDRLAAMLGINRATVIRATETLHELGLIQKDSHGGKAHRASYLPNWDHFRFIVAEWAARMKTGDRPTKSNQPAKPAVPKVASLQRSQSQGCDVEGRRDATQTNRINQSKEPIETARVETAGQEPPSRPSSRLLRRLWRGSKPDAQRSMLLPITGGGSPSHADAAKGAAERRWLEQVHALGLTVQGDVIEWMNADRQEAATQAEMKRRGGGLAFIVSAMQNERMRAHG
ncbi:helix-turn-helix domain-containing protein [Rhizobium sp. FKY42]|uniref:helix-turn-helix domain-containing protein n=1 Tax=Rhizobium sp. FKY42 TaxID=2562310 RepID=UPI0010C13D7B|nr:helix-turn-helix domain-containing protein [Rhizobium sp. FKY42]